MSDKKLPSWDFPKEKVTIIGAKKPVKKKTPVKKSGK